MFLQEGAKMEFPFQEWLKPVDLSVYPAQKPGEEKDKRLASLFASQPRPGELASIRICLLGVPQDIGVQRNGGRAGARNGPAAFREQFYKLTPFYAVGTIDHPDTFFLDLGDLRCEGIELEEIHWRQEQIVLHALQNGWIPIIVGGGHDIAFPNGLAMGRAYDSIGILNFDSHLDVRPLIEGQKAHSGSPFRQLLTHPDVFIPPGCLIEFGAQWFLNAESHWEFLKSEEATIYWLHDIRNDGFPEVFERSVKKLKAAVEGIYVTFDLDGIISSEAPGVSAPAAIGLTGYEYCYAAYLLGKEPIVKMMDVAELNPSYDVDNRTAKIAAQVVAHFIAGVIRRLY